MKNTHLFLVLSLTGLMAIFASCTDEPINSATVTDADGNVYHTVKIGTQTWMVENLKTTKYNDGTAIPNVTDNTAWSNLSTAAYCWYVNEINYKNTNGALYNWYAVNTGKLAPVGWHVPTDVEWTTLITYGSANLGTSGSLAKALAANVGWVYDSNEGAIGKDLSKNNSSGFSAIPGSFRDEETGGFSGPISSYGAWWSATQYTYSSAWYRSMFSSNNTMGRFYDSKQYGFSVRCIKD